jgi:hypothetical protein
MYTDRHVNYSLFFSYFKETRIFSTDIRKNHQISKFLKIRPVWATDRQTYISNLTVALPNFAKAPEKKNERMIFDGMDPSRVVMN